METEDYTIFHLYEERAASRKKDADMEKALNALAEFMVIGGKTLEELRRELGFFDA